MSRKITHLDIDDLRQRYFSYQRFSHMAKELGVSVNVISRYFREMGLPMGNISSRIPKDELVSLYLSGESERSLSKRYNCARLVIKAILKDIGITRRNNADANRLMMSRRTREENIKNAQAAHMAVKGKPQTEEHRRKIAASVERNGGNIGFGEKILSDIFIEKGLIITPQKAIGRYNVDIAIEEFSIAVEVFGGGWHIQGRHAFRFRKRMDTLIDSGWIPVIIWGKKASKDTFVGAAEYVISLVDRLRSGESVPRQEHVISGDGNPCACGKGNIEYRAAIGGDKCGDIIRGKDGRFTHDTVRM